MSTEAGQQNKADIIRRCSTLMLYKLTDFSNRRGLFTVADEIREMQERIAKMELEKNVGTDLEAGLAQLNDDGGFCAPPSLASLSNATDPFDEGSANYNNPGSSSPIITQGNSGSGVCFTASDRFNEAMSVDNNQQNPPELSLQPFLLHDQDNSKILSTEEDEEAERPLGNSVGNMCMQGVVASRMTVEDSTTAAFIHEQDGAVDWKSRAIYFEKLALDKWVRHDDGIAAIAAALDKISNHGYDTSELRKEFVPNEFKKSKKPEPILDTSSDNEPGSESKSSFNTAVQPN
ncbi:hypothetical protein K488DRAFT_82361 [Vararia minispora EC-137]|uniref:Uncharacterized protein n=1 Tax=Vararia minispora EC-137 TaxID=1314806 RepID=A0ACB8QW82_9AGAM|nr:hypothetical protein K488DRAFT_82361 [Vararia minispora EC-137]